MYNGIGLLTPRGSGTSGYVTANKFNLRRAPPPKDEVRKESDAPKQQKPNDGILLHNRKREIEVKLFELRMKLEDADDLDEEQIEKMVEMERTVLEDKFKKQEQEKAKESKSNTQETHEVARRKMEQMERLRGALGIHRNAKEGEAFDVELQEQRKRERKEKRETMELERRQRAKEEKKRREAAEDEHVQKRKSHDRSHKSREKRRSRDDRSPERERRPTQERADPHREEPHEQSQREERWLADERRGYDNEQRMISDAEGGVRNGHWSNERSRPRYRTMGYEQPYYQPRFNNHYQFRGGFYQRRPYYRGRGRGYFGGRNFGYYRKDEVAPERYNPMVDDPSDAMLDRRQEDWDRQVRWPKSNLAADLQQGPSKEQTVYYDARASVHGPSQGRDVAVEERSQTELSSPVPNSPTCIKHSPTNPRCFRRSLHHRSRPPSPLSPGGTPTEPEAKRTAVETETKSKSASPKAEKETCPVPRQRQDKGDARKRSTSASSGYSSNGKSSSRSPSSSSRSRSPRRRSRRDLSPSPERRPPWRDSRLGGRRFGSYGRGRYSDSYRGNGRFRRSYSGAGYGSRRGGGYRYNGRDEQRRRSRSGGRKKRSETRSTSSSGSFSSRDRSRSPSKDDTNSKGDRKGSKAPGTNPTGS